ncbi:MAG: recombinase family protein [Gracilibacteraceae bacterium]|jgi:DNA invertase Pin-like site-specific DNA recombinase|nr:recombinase family protein [Gracilibacteraceae bacterium]
MPDAGTDVLPAIPYTIALYLRISHEDGRGESNSITNQRDMIRAYIAGRREFENAAISEYVDDGESGESMDRRDYRRLMTDVERGAVDCIVVKDLSRIGRVMLDVDDILMNYLVTRGVRFIAINDGYDSFKHSLSNLELAMINLVNQHYNRDLAQKSITARLVKMKRGECLYLAPFGYKKSGTEKNRLVPDDEAAGYVRLMFSLACEGRRPVEIAQMLNAQGVPSPSVYKSGNGCKNIWTQAVDPDFCFWTNYAVRKIIMNEVYLGKAISNRLRVIEPGTGKTTPRPRKEWIIVDGAHEALVSETDFKKAQLVLPRKRCGDAPGHIFGNKVKCPTCGHAMVHYTKSNPRFKCGTVKFTAHYGCRTHTVLQSDLEKIVLTSVRALVSELIDREELELSALKRAANEKTELAGRIKTEENAVRLLEESIAKNFTALVSGKLSKDAFVKKKEIINGAITQKNAALETLRGRLCELTTGRDDVEGRLAELRLLLTVDRVDRALVDLTIDKILVHGERDIEIVWADGWDGETVKKRLKPSKF